MKRFRKFLTIFGSIVLLIFITIAIVLNFVLTPKKLTRLVTDLVNENIDGRFACSSIELTFFSSFPRFAVKVQNGLLQSNTSNKIRNNNDTIASFATCFVAFNGYKLLSKKSIDIYDITLTKPTLYLQTDSLGNGNWNIAKADTSASTDGSNMFGLSLDRFRLQKLNIDNANLNYYDGITGIHRQIADFNLHLKAAKGKRGMFLELTNENKAISFYRNPEKRYRIKEIIINASLAYTSADSIFTIKKSDLEIDKIRFSSEGTMQVFPAKKEVFTNLKSRLASNSLANIIQLIPSKFLNKDELTTTGNIDLQVALVGLFGHGHYPKASANLLVENASLKYKHFPGSIDHFNTKIAAEIAVNDTVPSFVNISSLTMQGTGVDVNISGKVTDVLKNALVDANIKTEIDFTKLYDSFPVNRNIEAAGNIHANLQTHFSLDDIKTAKYNNINLNGDIAFTNVKAVSAMDSFYFSTQKIISQLSNKKDKYNTATVSLYLNNTTFNFKHDIKFNSQLLKADVKALQTGEREVKLNAFVQTSNAVFESRQAQLFTSLGNATIRASLFPGEKSKPDDNTDSPRRFDTTGGRKKRVATQSDTLRNRLLSINADIALVGSNIKFSSAKDSIMFNAKNVNADFTNRKDRYNSLTGKLELYYANIEYLNDVFVKLDTIQADIKVAKTGRRELQANATIDMGPTRFNVKSSKLRGKIGGGNIAAILHPASGNIKAYIASQLVIDSLKIKYGKTFVGVKQGSYDIVLHLESRREWWPEGSFKFRRMEVRTPEFILPISIPGTRLSFVRDNITLDRARVKVGHSDAILTGNIEHVFGLIEHGNVSGSLTLNADFIDANELMQTFASQEKQTVAALDSIELTEPVIVANDSIVSTEKKAFKVPDNIKFNFNTDIKKLQFGDLVLDSIHGKLNIADGDIKLEKFNLKTLAANLDANLTYSAKNTHEPAVDFQLYLTDIEMKNIHQMMSFIDTLFPMAKSFEGKADFRIKGTAKLDESMNFKLQSIKAVAALKAKNVMVLDGPSFRDIAKTFMFKSKDKNPVETLSIEMELDKSNLNILPALLEIDRYKLAIGGIQHLDMSYDYHVSVLKSPVPFKTGFEIEGNGTNYKVKLSSAKYKYYFTDNERLMEKADAAIINKKEHILRELDF